MKTISFLILSVTSTMLYAQIGIGTPDPDPNSDLTLGSGTKGLLLNRVVLTNTNSGVFNAGMLVYNTATAEDVTPGAYISNGTVWTKLLTSKDEIGTANSSPLVFKTNNVERIRIDINGNLGVGTAAPQGILDVSSADSGIIMPRNTNPGSNITTPVAGMVIYDTTNKTLRYYNGTQWSSVLSSATLTSANEGVVRINSGSGVKPFFSFKTSGGIPLNAFQNIVYQTINLSTDLAAAPTTSWPENIASPSVSNIYNQATGRFLDNSVAGQVHTWRVIAKFDNKNNGSVGFVTVNMTNATGTLSMDQTAIAPNGTTTGSLVFYFVAVADATSIGSGYSFRVKSDTAMDLTIDNVLRVSQAKD
ncbi:hypothetical protein [Chryseobacterium arthrosphaerae]|uniref:hypothetical protein n=1 Tax=Chryseobacterium arthrosphaerae TaxID=651561 RepID=UPI000F5094AF|nr:hypothetical protein [Chryseobacterium arthrosphaerae]